MGGCKIGGAVRGGVRDGREGRDATLLAARAAATAVASPDRWSKTSPETRPKASPERRPKAQCREAAGGKNYGAKASGMLNGSSLGSARDGAQGRGVASAGTTLLAAADSQQPDLDDEIFNAEALQAFASAAPRVSAHAPAETILEAHVEYRGCEIHFGISANTTLEELSQMYTKWLAAQSRDLAHP